MCWGLLSSEAVEQSKKCEWHGRKGALGGEDIWPVGVWLGQDRPSGVDVGGSCDMAYGV